MATAVFRVICFMKSFRMTNKIQKKSDILFNLIFFIRRVRYFEETFSRTIEIDTIKEKVLKTN